MCVGPLGLCVSGYQIVCDATAPVASMPVGAPFLTFSEDAVSRNDAKRYFRSAPAKDRGRARRAR